MPEVITGVLTATALSGRQYYETGMKLHGEVIANFFYIRDGAAAYVEIWPHTHMLDIVRAENLIGLLFAGA